MQSPVQSRFTPYVFQQIPRDFALDYCRHILESEKVEYTNQDINFIINGLYPDIRRIVNILQKCSWEGKLDVDEEAVVTHEKKVLAGVVEIISLIEKGDGPKIGKVVNGIIELLAAHSYELEYRNIYEELFFMKKIPAPAKIIVNEYANTHQGCLIPHQHFLSMVFKINKALQDYRKAMIK